jgi:lipoprotein signal peptidase
VRGAVPARNRHLTTFTAVALAVVLGDLVTKQLALALVADGGASLGALGHLIGERVRLVLVANSQSAFGIALGPHTWGINVALTLGAILLAAPVCRELASLDASAPRSLGLIAGAAGGNLLSLVSSPNGVPDFIAIDRGAGHELVLNLADVAAYAGLALMLPLGLAILRRLREARAAHARS